MNLTTRLLFFCVLIFSFSPNLNAQPNDLMIIYDANQGVSGLVGANKVYMYSGAVTSAPSGQWEWITGSFNLDDGVGLMTYIGNNMWTICIDPAAYYGTGAIPILAIDIIFRNENGSAFGYDFNGNYTILDMTTPLPTSSFPGVTTGNCGVGLFESNENETVLSNFPNPYRNITTFTFNLPSGTETAAINVVETTGKCVQVLNLVDLQSGIQNVTWDAVNGKNKPLENGVYFYSLIVDGKVAKTNKMIIAR